MAKATEELWQNLDQMLVRYGDTALIAPRLQQWFEEDGRSAPQIAKALSQLTPPVMTSRVGIWKILNPEAKTGRRNVTLQEAIGFAKVFRKSLAELLLPESAMLEAEGLRMIEEAAERLNSIRSDWQEYEHLIRSIRNRTAARPELAERLRALEAPPTTGALQSPTPRAIALRDALTDAPLPHGPWWARPALAAAEQVRAIDWSKPLYTPKRKART
ncbi:hypothetical protein C5E02_01255 [Rathayibacter rathayi]|uniref:hypothetical protein n=1 Tax=Rathayibacter rathayi TaxID=33887 RepID=UPI000BC48C6B|nr:hypothetical protein [Rathayibacter rathayi]AZZ48005.1 hypothetical protein C1O28_01345 [Rathayibacter rathayi]MWV74721.1 hypothetical protein [Rathayibacter rathayi NCPPB 2980 = VKM Ac-1601]PPF50556.1 hypothetical protein C5C08_04865 [Rathayibacter rathayi]PPG13669.1 hypothetical protein C5C11_06760 [Rathayibacter rathayi]PPG45291.1 hypothetical protein C5C20_04470 [Rathayibacter rathayi]